jgi:hypothetical protein
MTMPKISDVKAAAGHLSAAGVPVDSSLGVVCMFIDAILSAPGMTSERLGELQGFTIRDCLGLNIHARYGAWTELLTEVLRLRAELELRK